MITISATLNHDLRGQSLAEEDLGIVKLLISHAMDLQRRFSLAERTVPLLSEILIPDSGVVKAVSGTYEGHAFDILRMQLFRILVVDLYAAIFDTSSQSGSLRQLIKSLRDERTRECLKAYKCDIGCYDITVRETDSEPGEIAHAKENFLQRQKQEKTDNFEGMWKRIDEGSVMLDSLAFKRMAWARNKLGAHFDRNGTAGLVAFDEEPKDREGRILEGGSLAWGEPIKVLHEIKSYVYDVFLFVTSAHWGKDFEKSHQFYAQSFWERFKTGESNLERPKLLVL